MSNEKVKMLNRKGFGLLRQTMLITLGLLLALGLAGCGNAAQPAPKPVDTGEKIIRTFVQAANDKDTEKMAASLAQDFSFQEIEDNRVIYEIKDKNAYIAELKDANINLNVTAISKKDENRWEVTGRERSYETEILGIGDGIRYTDEFVLKAEKITALKTTYHPEDMRNMMEKKEGIIGANFDKEYKFLNIFAGLPAEKAGLKPGDILKEIDGQKISDMKNGAHDVTYRIRGPIGTKVKLVVSRNGQEIPLEVVRVKDVARDGLKIIGEYEPVQVKPVNRIKMQEQLTPEEIKGKFVYHYEEMVEASPREYFYQEDNGKVILLKEGMWFLINDDYKNVTPKSSSMFGEAEKFRMKLKEQSKKQ